MRVLNSVFLSSLSDRSPCWAWSRIERVAAKYRRESWTALEVLSLDEVPTEDRLWVVLHESLLPSVVLRRFAVEVAADAMRLAGWTDARSWAALDAAMAFERGDIDAQAGAAAWAAARDAAGYAARDAAGYAAGYAARDAAGYAAGAAAWAAARDAARDAAGYAAGAAAVAAAWAAAWDAQIRTLRQITLRWLGGEDIAAGGPWKRPERKAA